MEWLASLQATAITAVSLFIGAVISQWRGWLYFRPQVEEIRKGYDKQLSDVREDREARIGELAEERAWLRDANNTLTQAHLMALAQIDELLDANRTTHTALQSIAREGSRPDG